MNKTWDFIAKTPILLDGKQYAEGAKMTLDFDQAQALGPNRIESVPSQSPSPPPPPPAPAPAPEPPAPPAPADAPAAPAPATETGTQAPAPASATTAKKR